MLLRPGTKTISFDCSLRFCKTISSDPFSCEAKPWDAFPFPLVVIALPIAVGFSQLLRVKTLFPFLLFCPSQEIHLDHWQTTRPQLGVIWTGYQSSYCHFNPSFPALSVGVGPPNLFVQPNSHPSVNILQQFIQLKPGLALQSPPKLPAASQTLYWSVLSTVFPVQIRAMSCFHSGWILYESTSHETDSPGMSFRINSDSHIRNAFVLWF